MFTDDEMTVVAMLLMLATLKNKKHMETHSVKVGSRA